VFDSMKAMEFDGVGGKVHFTDEGDLKDPQFSIMQLGEYVNGEDPVWSKVGLTGTQVDTARRTDVDTPMCFPVTGCVNSLSGVPGDSYPVPRDKLPGWAVALIVLVFALLVCLGFKYWRSHRSKRAIKKELDAFRDSVVGMRTAITHYVPTSTSLDGEEDVVVEQAKGNTASDSLVIHSKAKVTWCWRETPHYMNTHGPEDIEGDPSDCWIKYDDNSNSKLETAFQLQNGVGAYSPLPGYSVGFVTMKQTKLATGFQRDVQRLVSEPPKPIGGSRRVDLNGARIGERLPAEIQNEPQMVLVKGDVLQISKQRPDGWGFGTKLHHVDEAAARELVAHATGTYPGDDGEDLVGDGDEANIFADTGWFQLDATDLPSAEDLASLQKRVGDTDVLQAPPNWDPVVDPTVVQQHKLAKGEPEYDAVVNSFMSTLQNRTIKTIKVSRIQNLAMWQSYVVRRQTICYRETHATSEKAKNGDGSGNTDVDDAAQREALARFERCWLWHGTNAEVKDKIVQQGFNRSFCGKNATMYGKGVYFARDAAYSSYKTYAVPDAKGFQYILACRVVVGEYCPGKVDALTPDVRDPRTDSLYDSTVGLIQQDTMANPSIYVTYHDAQAYPEYLITFKQ